MEEHAIYLDGSYRLDWGSTAAADNNRIETYGLSGSFVFNTLADQDWLSFGKVKSKLCGSSYFPWNLCKQVQRMVLGTAYGSLASLNVPNTLANPNLTGGMRTELEYGVEMKFLKNRLGLDFTYFDREDSKPTSSNYCCRRYWIYWIKCKLKNYIYCRC